VLHAFFFLAFLDIPLSAVLPSFLSFFRYRDLNCNVEFEGFICEIQLHCEAHYVLKDEQHKVYSLCRSFGLMGDIDEEVTAMGAGDRTVSPLKTRVAVSILRSFSYILVIAWGVSYSTLGLHKELYDIYDHIFEGFPRICKVLSLCFLCWIVGGMLLTDMWKDGKGGFFFSLAVTSLFGFSAVAFASLNGFIVFFSWAAPLIYFITHVIWLRFRDTDNPTARIPRVALLYHQYFGVDGKYFALKSVATQSLSVLLQARAKLVPIGLVVADGVTEGWYWTFFCVLLLNCIAPPLLLSSKRLWRRRQGAMLFDIGCDLFYILGFVLYMGLHQGNPTAFMPTGVGSFFSNLFPLLRILSISRVLVAPRRRGCQENMQATGVNNGQAANSSRLTPKVASLFAGLSLLMLFTIIYWEQTVYPWDGNPCRPCECSADRILERCEHGGTQLFLAARGITRVFPGAFVQNDLPQLREIDLSRNAMTALENGTFTNLPTLKILRMDQNRANVTSWFLESFFPLLRSFVPTDSGLALLETNAFTNNSQLEIVWLGYNSLSSLDSLGGLLVDAADLQELHLVGNSLACEKVVAHFDGKCV
jgi:hypothetical protein